MKRSKKEKERKREEAFKCLKQYKGKEVAAVIKGVGRSGMSRRIEFFADGYNRIGYLIADILDYPYDIDKGLRVTGCGMDMVFHILSQLNYAMATHDTGKTLQKLLKTKECGERIYDNYFFDADKYILL